MSGRVLVVDDLAVNRRVLAAQLTGEYFEVRLAGDGPSALAMCEAEPFDLVILDIMMPGMDGFEVCRRLKARPSTQHVPVILLTALDQPEHRIAGLEAGADDFLTKPATNAALLSRMRALLRVKLAADEVRARLDVVSETAVRRQLQADLAHPGTGGRVFYVRAKKLERSGYAVNSLLIIMLSLSRWPISQSAAPVGMWMSRSSTWRRRGSTRCGFGPG